MDLILKILVSAFIGGLAHMGGMFLIYPGSPICKILEKKYNYDSILDKGNKISLIVAVMTAVVIFFYLP